DDLLSIINGGALPNKTFYDNGGYVTLAMAQTLLAQVYLQRAGAPLNGGREYYAKAAAMAQQVINSNTHALIDPDGTTDDLTSAFNIIKTSKKTNVASKIEIIYAKEYNQSGLGVGNSYAARSIEKAAFQGWKLLHPAGDVLYTAYRPCNMLIESYHPGDIRGHNQQFFFKEYISPHDGNKYTLNAQGNWAWYDEAALIGGRNGDYNMPMFRYAEVLLIAAEGYAQTGENTKARDYLNQVRKRAGLEDETAAAGEALVKIILTERFHEFPLEFKIWDDIRRTRLYPEADGVESGNLKWTSLESATIQNKPKQNETTVGAIKPYVLLWPIPLREMQANPALAGHQNPGWE
ncbi:MAG: RagB/SusD family nutrient uptake outer membrane protein, partial [Proteiniphilum sp.]|nr:RagB/SusD family nutrient uptake outer membrane protein [Proteiniphilum sp.]